MRIAVCYDDKTGEVFGHFGETQFFKLYEVDDDTKEITASEVKGTEGYSHTALIGLLSYYGADLLLSGGMGGHARDLLDKANIRYFPGVSGNADEQVAAYLAGNLQYDMDTTCPHHEHHHGHGEDGGCCGHHH